MAGESVSPRGRGPLSSWCFVAGLTVGVTVDPARRRRGCTCHGNGSGGGNLRACRKGRVGRAVGPLFVSHGAPGAVTHDVRDSVGKDGGMKVQLLYFVGCPNWKETDARIRDALEIVGRGDLEVEHVLVSTPEHAEQMHFTGSPTILVNGKDPFAAGGDAVGLSCRLYATSSGPAGAPPVEQLIDVLQG